MTQLLFYLAIFLFGSYLIGSIPFGMIIGKAHGVDLRQAGSGNIGATNVGRVLGRKWGYCCFVLDVAKGLLPVLAAGLVLRHLAEQRGEVFPTAMHQVVWLSAALGAVLGHVFCLFLRFRGGKGVATALGVLLGVYPYFTLAGLLAFALWIVVTLISRYVSLGSVVAAAAFAPLFLAVNTLLFGWEQTAALTPLLIFAIVIAALLIVRHRTNIKRLLAGTENKIGRKSSPESIPSAPPGQFERLGPSALRVWAPAKLNLDLRVYPRRGDGMHPLDSIVVKITLCDRIDLRRRDDGQIRLACQGADCGPAEKNLAFRAAQAICGLHMGPVDGGGGVRSVPVRALPPGGGARNLAEASPPDGGTTNRAGGVEIDLTKAIPPGKGLGGGSSDAAAVLAGLNRLFGLDLPAGELAALAAELGSDVPLFLGPPASRMTGRGEILHPAAVHPFAAVLYMGDLFCSTAAVYAAFDQLPPPADRTVDAGLLASAPPSAWAHLLRNDLLRPAEIVCPALTAVRERLARQSGRPVCLTGSGSSLFILCDDAAEAQRTLARLDADLRSRCVIVRNNAW